jgi:hypothetical protein
MDEKPMKQVLSDMRKINKIFYFQLTSRESRKQEIGGVGAHMSQAELREKAVNTAAAISQVRICRKQERGHSYVTGGAQIKSCQYSCCHQPGKNL